MKKIPKFIWILITLAVLYGAAKVAWSIAYPSATLHYRMTVSVETPEGIKTGSAVREVLIETHPQLLGETSVGSVSVKGEAVTVDLGKRGVLFALLRGGTYGEDYGSYILTASFPVNNGPVSREGIEYYRSLETGKVVLTPVQYPMFVRFRDPKDPKTVENLLDMKSCPDPVTNIPDNSLCLVKDHFEDAFGTGVRLKEVTVEITDEPVTSSIEKWLPWLKALNGNYLHGGSTARGAPLGLYGSNFKAGGLSHE